MIYNHNSLFSLQQTKLIDKQAETNVISLLFKWFVTLTFIMSVHRDHEIISKVFVDESYFFIRTNLFYTSVALSQSLFMVDSTAAIELLKKLEHTILRVL